MTLDDDVLPVSPNTEPAVGTPTVGTPAVGTPAVGTPAADRAGRSFETFYVESWPWAVRVATLITQSGDAGQEIAQDSLLAVYQRWGDIDLPKAYLRRAIVNRCQNWQRGQHTRRQKLPLLVETSTVELGASDLADLIAGLPTRQRAVLVLRYYCDFSEAEIADALGCRPGTVKSLSFRALRRLRKEIPR